jgi:hypothetical protein
LPYEHTRFAETNRIEQEATKKTEDWMAN